VERTSILRFTLSGRLESRLSRSITVCAVADFRHRGFAYNFLLNTLDGCVPSQSSVVAPGSPKLSLPDHWTNSASASTADVYGRATMPTLCLSACQAYSRQVRYALLTVVCKSQTVGAVFRPSPLDEHGACGSRLVQCTSSAQGYTLQCCQPIRHLASAGCGLCCSSGPPRCMHVPAPRPVTHLRWDRQACHTGTNTACPSPPPASKRDIPRIPCPQ
jgi:hypothetical protein